MTSAVVVCPVCQESFETIYGKSLGRKRVYCSPRCAWTLKNQKRQEQKLPAARVCAQCKSEYMPTSVWARQRFCSADCRDASKLGPETRIYTCGTCGAEWQKARQVGGRVPQQCPTCVDSRPWRSHPRHRAKVYERDNWVCQICFLPIDQQAKFPQLEAPSVDHILPVSLGGTNVISNLRAAHWGCNWSRGNGVSPPRSRGQRKRQSA